MMIRQDFEELPPKMFMMQILDKVTKTYISLWEKKDNLNRLFLNWKYLSKNYNMNAFRTSLRKLCDEGLLSYDESEDGIAIELVGWSDISEE